tara:strand:- start:19050 stop:19547 length:498 start_codon:yes stop_codon:yes gene_type:complete
MALEIERRFLIRSNKWKNFVIKKTLIEQGYFLTKTNEWTIRIRSENKRFKLTLKKLLSNFTNYEFEYDIPSNEGEIIISKLTNKIFKERFYLLINKQSWVIDIFKDKNQPLEIAEIELKNEDEKIEIPTFISKEITGIKMFSNFELAKAPLSTWKKENFRKFFKH